MDQSIGALGKRTGGPGNQNPLMNLEELIDNLPGGLQARGLLRGELGL